MTPGGRARDMWPRCVKIHFVHQMEGNEKQNTVVQKFCPGGMSEGH